MTEKQELQFYQPCQFSNHPGRETLRALECKTVFGAGAIIHVFVYRLKEGGSRRRRRRTSYLLSSCPRSDAPQLNLNHLQLMCHLRGVCGDGCVTSGGESAVSEASPGPPRGRGGASAEPSITISQQTEVKTQQSYLSIGSRSEDDCWKWLIRYHLTLVRA